MSSHAPRSAWGRAALAIVGVNYALGILIAWLAGFHVEFAHCAAAGGDDCTVTAAFVAFMNGMLWPFFLLGEAIGG